MARANYLDYREDLRIDFWFSCAYCSITESESLGMGFEIDHYLARTHHPELVSAYTNLNYACKDCNGQKLDLPTDADLADGLPILRPDVHDFREHLEADGHRVRGLTRAGVWTVDALLLNRGPLVALREIRQRLGYARELLVSGLRFLARAKIDGIPKEFRVLFLRTKRALEEAGEEVEVAFRAELRECLASPLLDAVGPRVARARKAELAALRSTLVDGRSL